MSPADPQAFDDQVLIRYILGSLPEKEAERLDILSIADDAFAWRLNAVEHDLLDAFVSGELSGDDLLQFRKSYLSSPNRLQNVEFAGALSSSGSRGATAAAQALLSRAAPSSEEKDQPMKGFSPRRWFPVSHLALQWGFAGGALVLLFTAGYVLFENARMRRQTTEGQRSQAAFEQRERELQFQLLEQRSATTELAMELDLFRKSRPNLEQLKTVSALLLSPKREAGPIPTVSIPRGTDLVVLLLTLESYDFPNYRAGLKDAATDQTVWHNANLEVGPGGDNKAVVVSFPAHLLKQKNYVIELFGAAPNGRAEFITGYPIRVAIK
jgi:hypothetical protein